MLAAAERGQVVVTRTVRDLATGTDLAFSPLVVTNLRGVPGEWELFEARTSDRCRPSPPMSRTPKADGGLGGSISRNTTLDTSV